MKSYLIKLLFIFMLTVATTAWSAPVTTYIAEFSVSGVSDVIKSEEIKATIRTLLLSRLTSEKISTTSQPEGVEIKISGSYLLSGSVFSLDAAAANNTGKVIARAFAQGKSPDDLIPAVGTLAKSLEEGINRGQAAAVTPQSSPKESDIIKAAPSPPAVGQNILKVDGALSGLALGRTLPGGERELFMIGSHVLRYYRQGKELKLMAEIPFKVFEKVLAVDTADLDGNGSPEIYVTVITNDILASQVFVVEGASLIKTADRLPYFFRTIFLPDGVKKLYAQQMSNRSDFAGDVSEVRLTKDGYTLSNPLKMPKSGYLYNFALLKKAEKTLVTVLLDRGGFLRAYSVGGDELSKGVLEVGGSETYFQRSDLSGEGPRKVYLEQRMIRTPKGELLVAKNTASWFMLGKNSYSKSALYAFTWDGANLNETWHTRQNDYYLADIAYDESSHEVLMLEVVAKEEGLFDKWKSRVVIRKVE